MPKLLCKSEYQSRFRDKNIGYAAGAVVEASEELAEFLYRDAPGNFEEAKELEAPPADKQVKKPAAKKAPAKKAPAKKQPSSK